jgi:hypothetical protein
MHINLNDCGNNLSKSDFEGNNAVVVVVVVDAGTARNIFKVNSLSHLHSIGNLFHNNAGVGVGVFCSSSAAAAAAVVVVFAIAI